MVIIRITEVRHPYFRITTSFHFQIFWWAHKDSNLGQSGYEPEALPTEL